jgi:hypothetical protein
MISAMMPLHIACQVVLSIHMISFAMMHAIIFKKLQRKKLYFM